MNGSDAIRSTRFRQEREASWRRLETLAAQVERRGLAALSYGELSELTEAYRQAMNSLSVARDISMDRALLTYLERLCARAYLVVYAPQEGLGGLISRLYGRGIPEAVRRRWPALLLATLALFLGALVGWRLTVEDPSWFYSFVPPGLAGGRTPSATAELLRQTLHDSGVRSLAGTFASYLFTHNARIAILIFCTGVACAVPSFALTFYNGLILGAFFSLFAGHGLGYELFAWLSVHGVTELAATCVACAGGAELGLAVLMPGELTRREALRDRGRDAMKLLALAATMLVAAALLEGVVRQTVQAPALRIAIGWGVGTAWLLWLTLAGRRGT
jgi:uncharacterized membrane protein SpoIIM required for sporulation